MQKQVLDNYFLDPKYKYPMLAQVQWKSTKDKERKKTPKNLFINSNFSKNMFNVLNPRTYRLFQYTPNVQMGQMTHSNISVIYQPIFKNLMSMERYG